MKSCRCLELGFRRQHTGVLVLGVAATHLEEQQRQGRYGYDYSEGELATAEREAGKGRTLKLGRRAGRRR